MADSNKQFSFDKFLDFVNDNFSLILIILLMFFGGFLAGSMWRENQMLKTDSGAVAGAEADLPTEPQGPDVEQLKQVPKVSKSDHTRGADKPKITIIEYSDYECPFCNRFHLTMQKVMKNYGDDVQWVYRHFPLESMHQNARKMAEASECIAKYGGNEKFWEFTDIIYERIQTDQTIAEPENYMAVVSEIGVSANQVQSCVDSDEMADVVTEQMAGGRKASISGTPGSLLITKDGEYDLIPGALPYEQIEAKIEQYL